MTFIALTRVANKVKTQKTIILELEMICFNFGKVGWHNLWCNSDKVVLTLEKAINQVELAIELIGH